MSMASNGWRGRKLFLETPAIWVFCNSLVIHCSAWVNCLLEKFSINSIFAEYDFCWTTVGWNYVKVCEQYCSQVDFANSPITVVDIEENQSVIAKPQNSYAFLFLLAFDVWGWNVCTQNTFPTLRLENKYEEHIIFFVDLYNVDFHISFIQNHCAGTCSAWAMGICCMYFPNRLSNSCVAPFGISMWNFSPHSNDEGFR